MRTCSGLAAFHFFLALRLMVRILSGFAARHVRVANLYLPGSASYQAFNFARIRSLFAVYHARLYSGVRAKPIYPASCMDSTCLATSKQSKNIPAKMSHLP